MWRIAVAEWRTNWWINLIGPVFVVGVLALIQQELLRCDCAATPERQLFVTKMLFAILVYCQFSMAMWAHNALYGPKTRQRLTETLPLSQRKINLTRVFTAFLFMCVGFFSWIFVFAVWHWNRQPSSVWVAVFATLCSLCFLLVCMRRIYLKLILFVGFPLIWIPASERILWPLFLGAASPWGSLVLGIVVLLWGWWVIEQPPPRWARG